MRKISVARRSVAPRRRRALIVASRAVALDAQRTRAQGSVGTAPLHRVRLTRFTDNALRCLMRLAIDPGAPHTAREIARAMAMSEDHLTKVIRRLTQLGHVRTQRGRTGGISLARDPADIRIGALIRATEDNLTLVECFDSDANECPIASACPLARGLRRALAAFLTVLDELTLADLVAHPRRLERLLRPT